MTVRKKSNINLHILSWALCWLVSIRTGPGNQKEHSSQQHNKTKQNKCRKPHLAFSPSLHGCLLAVPSAQVGSSPSAQVQRPPRLLFVIEYFDIEKEMLFPDLICSLPAPSPSSTTPGRGRSSSGPRTWFRPIGASPVVD